MQNKITGNSKYSLTLLIFGVFCLLAGGSSTESSDEKKARLIKSENISESVYDARVRDFGSYDDYKSAVSKGMNAQKFAQYKSQKAACQSDWRKCSDNEQLVNDWSGWSKVQVACKFAANDRAKYGEPEWPWLSFSTFLKGSNYVKTGVAIAIEPDAKFMNGFNAKVRSRVTCTYNLTSDRVDNLIVADR